MTIIKKIFRVFISCPSDVDNERELARKACEDISKTYGVANKIEVKPLDYRNEVIPYISGNRTQKVISDQIEKPGYEIYVGIFWKRFGDKKNNGLTPTKEEYQNALKSCKKNGKPLISFFFKCKKYYPENVDERMQADEVLNFKSEIRESDIGLYKEFKNDLDFYSEVRNAIEYFVFNFNSLTNKKIRKNKITCEAFSDYILRKVTSIQYPDSQMQFYSTEKHKDLIDIILEQDRVVLIGDAGTGKTTELNRANFVFSKNESTFIPYLISLNTYTNQSIYKLLPENWNTIPQKTPVVILDGLDEIESKNKRDAIRNIERFSINYPDVKILISCRNNFYNSEGEKFPGTLKGFSTYILLDLEETGINKYINKKLGIQEENFIEIIFNNRLEDIIKIPFYLINLVDLFKKEKNIPQNRTEIFEKIINLRIDQDIEKFRTTATINLKEQKNYIISILEIIALTMETLGRNYIYDEELEKIPQIEDKKEIIEFCMLEKKKQDNKIIWNFEHNNFQEYLAARILSKQPLEIIKKFIFFPPEYKLIIPSWLNTLSFLVSIYKNNDFINWIIDKCPEATVKFEKDKIDKIKRIEIFKMIFNRYKENKTWINQDKFRYFELASFGQSIEIINFLLEAGNKEYHYTTTFNVIELLRYMNMPIPRDIKKHINDFLLNVALNYENEIIQSHALLALADLKLNSKEIIDKILEKLRNSPNDRIRYAIYYLINSSEYLDENIDICLEGLQYCSKMEIVIEPGVRRENRIIDEEIQLRTCFKKAKSFNAIEKIVKYFIAQPEQLENPIFENTIKDIAENAVSIYSKHQEVFIFLVDLFISFVKKYMDKQAKDIIYFFDKTNTRLQAFKKVYYEKLINKEDFKLLAILANKECIEFVISEYLEEKIKDENIKMFQNLLNWENFTLFLIFNKEINDKTNDKFLVTLPKSHEKERKERIQKDFDLLFDGDIFLEEIKKVFDIENKISFSREELLNLKMKYLKNYNFSDIVLHTLIEFAKGKEITLKEVEEYINKNSESFCIFKIYKYLNSYNELEVSSLQKGFIEDWCKRKLKNVDFKNALKVEDDGKNISVNTQAVHLWYFLRKFKFSYPRDVLLDMLSFDWLENGGMVGIDYLREYLSIKDIKQRIFKNLEESKDSKYALKNYLQYCKQKNLKEIIPYAVNIIISRNKDPDEDLRNSALEVISELSTSLNELEQLLIEVKDKFKWIIVEKLFKKKSTKLKDFLIEILKSSTFEDKIKASKYLVKLNDFEGLEYYTNWLVTKKSYKIESLIEKSPLIFLESIKAIPPLIKLLEKSYHPEFIQDDFYRLDSDVLDALNNIALKSEKNYVEVKDVLEKFITKNSNIYKNVHFLNLFLEKLERKFYFTKVEKVDIEDAIKKLEFIK